MPHPALLKSIDELIHHLLAFERRHTRELHALDAAWADSARNLLHYLAMRQRDLRGLQLTLTQSGLSSLGRSEAAVLSTLLEVRARLAATVHATGAEVPALEDVPAATPWSRAETLLHEHTRALFGDRPAGRHVYVMATAPSAREADAAWMEAMLAAGMDVLRINTAHEGPAEWSRILAALRSAAERAGRPCRVLVDLPGPKLRIGPVVDGQRVLKLRPQRDALGRTTTPFRVTLAPRAWIGQTHTTAGPTLFVEDRWLDKMRPGDTVEVIDTRDRRRTLVVTAVEGGCAVAECERTTYFAEGCTMRWRRGARTMRKGVCGPVPAVSARVEVRAGDPLVLRADAVPGQPAVHGAAGEVLRPATVSCEVPAALDHLKVGDRVLFDDGKVEAVVEAVALPEVLLRVQRGGSGLARLRAEKGINLPDTTLDLPALGPDDRVGLEFALGHADIVGLSFLRRAEDLDAYLAALAAAPRHLGLVLKIETRQGFEALPALMLRAMRWYPLGVMIARGDLAVECGFERLAELQEEILWFAEAAHLPAIWATQVLDGLAQTGVPSRAEVTDASVAVQAECVMLNKGPFIARAVRVLDDILRRMERHQYKKRQLYRRLAVSTRALSPTGE
jgi:pyruvate kinase